jgi:hypothetical protein
MSVEEKDMTVCCWTSDCGRPAEFRVTWFSVPDVDHDGQPSDPCFMLICGECLRDDDAILEGVGEQTYFARQDGNLSLIPGEPVPGPFQMAVLIMPIGADHDLERRVARAITDKPERDPK